MPRAKNRVASRAKRKKILSHASGYYSKRGSCYSIAKDSFFRSGNFAYRDRRQKKRNFRSLWIIRINAAARLHGIPYSTLISGLKEKKIELNRKSLAHLALHEPETFKKIIETVKA